MLLCLFQRTQEHQRGTLRHEWEGVVSWQLLMTTNLGCSLPWEAANGSSRSKCPSLGTNPNQCRDWDYASATLKTSNNVGIVSSCEWCSSCVVGQPLWLRLPQMVFLLSAGAFQGFPGARQSISVRGQHCVPQQELMLPGFKREELVKSPVPGPERFKLLLVSG